MATRNKLTRNFKRISRSTLYTGQHVLGDVREFQDDLTLLVYGNTKDILG